MRLPRTKGVARPPSHSSEREKMSSKIQSKTPYVRAAAQGCTHVVDESIYVFRSLERERERESTLRGFVYMYYIYTKPLYKRDPVDLQSEPRKAAYILYTKPSQEVAA